VAFKDDAMIFSITATAATNKHLIKEMTPLYEKQYMTKLWLWQIMWVLIKAVQEQMAT